MIALLTLLGLGAFVGILAGGSDGGDGDAVSEADPDGGMPPLEAAPRVFDDGPQTLAGAELRVTIEDFLIGEGASEVEQQDRLDSIDFLAGPLNINTGGGDDLVAGSGEADRIQTGTGSDLVYGGAGDDIIELGDGDDASGVAPGIPAVDPVRAALIIGAGDQTLEAGDDWIRGGLGNDVIVDGYGMDRLAGNQGDDLIISVDQDGGSPDVVLGGFGADQMIVDEGDEVETGRGVDRVIVDVQAGVEAGYDVVTITDFNFGVDRVELFEADPSAEVTVADLADNTGAVISVGGVPVVVVLGGQGLSASDVSLLSGSVSV
jgi:Ca2+-binding RTX toxin-like protein